MHLSAVFIITNESFLLSDCGSPDLSIPNSCSIIVHIMGEALGEALALNYKVPVKMSC